MTVLDELKTLYDTRQDEIEQWLGAQREKAAPFITSSVDLRHSGTRLVPVDTNLYPAGFNNLSANAQLRAVRQLSRYFEEHFPVAKHVLIVPENHTRNLAYLDNLAMLISLFKQAGFEAELGSLQAHAGETLELISRNGTALKQYALQRDGKKLITHTGFVPDVVVLNNDFTSGPVDLLDGISQPVLPPMERGWWQRRKSVHFAAYRELAQDFGNAFGIDPWRLGASFHACGFVDFKERTGLDCVAKEVDRLIAEARVKHQQYDIAEDPYIYIKADSGTYGMGIMTVRDGSEMLELNKKERNKMQVIKEGARVSEVILQEGVPTIDQVNGNPAEPMIYMIDGIPVGGMWRINASRDAYNNLNAAGMEFTGMCDEGETITDCRQPVRDCHFHSYGLIAVLAALAAGRETYGVNQKVHAASGTR